MKLDYTTPLFTFDEKPFKGDDGEDITLGMAILMACRGGLPSDEQLSAMDKFAIGEIGHLVHKELDLTTEQVAKVKERCGKMFNPILVHAIFKAIETPAPKAETKAKKAKD